MSTDRSATSARPWSALVGTLHEYAIFTLDADGVIDSWNAGVHELLGYEEHEFVGQRGEMIFTPEDRAKRADEHEFTQAREAGEAMDDRWHLRKDGTRIWVNGIMHGVRNDAGILVGYLKIMRDQTAKRTADDRLRESEERFAKAFRSNPTPIAILEQPVPRIVDVNEAFTQAFRLERPDAIGRTPTEVGVEPDEDQLERVRTEMAREHATRTEAPFRRNDGERGHGTFAFEPIELGGARHAVMLMHDVTEWRRMHDQVERRALEQSAFADLAASTLSTNDLLPILDLAVRRVADALGAGHVHIVELGDDAGAIGRTSLRTDDATVDASTLAGAARFDEIRRSLLRDDAGPWSEDVLAPLGLKSGIRARIRGRGRFFGLIEALSERAEAFSEDDVRFLRSIAHLLAGAIEQHRLHTELAHRAEHDDLTGLLTRVAFERRLVDALARAERQGTKVAALFLDLDRFKNINDSLGHQAGDEILRNVAKRLRDTVRSWDVIARHGGDEFVLFLPDIGTSSETAHVTTRLLEAFKAPFTVAGRELMIGTTVGVATFPDDGEDAETLLRAADTALYEGKIRGRSTYHFFTREQNEKVSERLELETDLRRALERDEFDVAYQPQIDLNDDAARVVEALIRWHRPDRGNLAPTSFLPVAEAIGLAVPIGEWTLRRAFADHAGWGEHPGAPERVAVNVAPSHFIQPSFPDAFASLARDANVEPHAIEIELTEETLLKDPDLVEDHLRALHELGVRIVLDDFGTSASPIARLRRLPIDRLKIDETFTHHLDDEGGRNLVDAIVQVAAGLGIEPTAEGIETDVQHHAVRELGFRTAQGRLYSAPLARDELLAFLKQRAS